MSRVYLDNAATTSLSPEVLDEMMPYLTVRYGNPSSIYREGAQARKAVEKARKQVADAINASDPEEIVFTSGGSEADNLAIKGAVFASGKKNGRIITTAIEHHAVLRSCEWLEQMGYEIVRLPVDLDGTVHASQVLNAITDNTIMISVMMANNEIGTIQPIAMIGRIARDKGVLFHTDAVQAVGAVELNVQRMNVDLLSMSAHKFHGPKGVGALYVRDGVWLDPIIHGGDQEHGLRAGTENTAGIVGMGVAIEKAVADRYENAQKASAFRELFIREVFRTIPGVFLNGSVTNRLPGNCSITFKGVDAESLLLRLSLAGVSVSAGSACTSGSLEPSHVLKAIGLTDDDARSTVRFSFSAKNTHSEVKYVANILPEIVESIRKMRETTDMPE